MKIVYLISGMFKPGGIERVITNKANYFAQRGDQVLIITTDQAGRDYFFPVDSRVRKLDLGLNYDRFDELPTWKRYWETYKLRGRHKRLLTQALMIERADFVVSVWRHEVGFLPSIKDGSRKILELHSSKLMPVLMYPEDRHLKRILGRLRMRLHEREASRYDCLVTLTEVERGLWHRLSNVEVIPNALTFEVDECSALEHPIVIAAGRMEYEKNFSSLISVWSKVSKLCPGWILRIYGNGWMRPQLEEQAKRLGVWDSIQFMGVATDMKAAYKEASIFALTSHFEGLGMVILEAFSVGVPVVSYACPSGPKEIVEDGKTGFLVNPGDEDLFSTRLVALMNDEALRKQMGRQARERSRKFSPDRIMKRWEELFTKLTLQR